MDRLISRFRLIPLILFACTLIARAEWEQREINGRGYVSVESIKAYYQFTSLKRTGKGITLEDSKTRLNLSVGGVECLMNGIKFVFSYPVVESAGKSWISRIDLVKLIHPVLRPTFIENAGTFRTVIIDPGHGGKDAGATNRYGTESRYNLQVAKLLKQQLEAAQFKVVMTRSDDHYLTLQQRVDVANAVRENAIFISIHHNSGRSAARGIETFTLSPVGVAHYGRGLKASDFRAATGNSHDSANVALATAVHGMLLSKLADKTSGKQYTLDRGIKRARFSVLTGVRHPSILVECGFMTNPYEAKLIHDSGYQRTLAKLIANAVSRYRFAVGRQPSAPAPPAMNRTQ
ncbi:N-acetylmuramoyl-L-alanine amidase [Haloferula luteola]|uniref:N-acetylmuramoyl-L-alanine amidase n=1 Tax=Haloferula luteola TaxID=595692 RepID=A0A840UYC5_9BACT|nr:N-acetylmuramoyl-L-alanine amidase [Haloferula luteola]MBB5351147.1 N-acetylmuramoyl-L-alanine amidase [Haloferula luteola]